MTDWEARARAAERTVAVLKRKVVELYDGGGSAILQTLAQVRAREMESARRHEELVRYNGRLEAEVAARTHELQTILDNVVFGFLVVGPDLAIHGFTRSCVELLGRDGLDGAELGDALGFPPERRLGLELALVQIFDDALATDLALAQLPREAVGGAGRTLRLVGRVIRAPNNAIDYVLITITDATELQTAQRENAHYQLLVRLLRQREELAMFVADLGALARDARGALARGEQLQARRAVHTMKGNAGCFGLAAVVALIHEVEEAPLDAAAIDRIERALADFLHDNADVLGVSGPGEAGGAWVSPGELAELEAIRGRPAAVASWVRRARRRPIQILLAPLAELTRQLGQRFDKRVELVLEGGDLRVDVDALAPIARELGHLVRNAIDHGIEPEAERAGKPWPARLVLRVAETPVGHELTLEDDGRGIDVDRVVERAIALGFDAGELATRTRAQLLQLVFVDGLTTRETVTEVSGRGVGMSALAAAVRRAGGEIAIESRVGQGTRIQLRIARPQLERASRALTGPRRGRCSRRGDDAARQGPHR